MKPCNAIGVILEEIIKSNRCFKMKDLTIDGCDVMSRLHLREGKLVGTVLNEVLEKVINGELPNERMALVAYLMKKHWQKTADDSLNNRSVKE